MPTAIVIASFDILFIDPLLELFLYCRSGDPGLLRELFYGNVRMLIYSI